MTGRTKMKQTTLIYLVLLFFSPPPELIFAGSTVEWISGEVVDRHGFLTSISRIGANHGAGFVTGRHMGRKISIDFKEIRRVENLGGLSFRVQKTSGEKLRIEEGELYSTDAHGLAHGRTCYKTGEWGEINFYYYDEAQKKETLFTLCQAHILALVFGESPGPLKWNPETGLFFPPDFEKDPETGQKLEQQSPRRWNLPSGEN